MTLLLVLLACRTAADLDSDADGTAGTDPPAPEPAVRLDAPPAFDPIGGSPMLVSAWGEEARGSLHVEVTDAGGQVLAAADGDQHGVDLAWDGRTGDGAWATPGAYTVTATLTGEDGELVASATTALVRVGIVSVSAEDDDGATATRIPLYWHRAQVLQDEAAALGAIAALDDSDGAPLAFARFTDPGAPPTDGAVEPVAYSADSRPILVLMPGTATVLGATGLHAADVHLRVDGWTVLSGNPIRDGAAITLQRDDTIDDGVGFAEETLSLVYEATAADGSTRWVAGQELPFTAYALLGPDTFVTDEPRYAPWVAAVDPLARAIAGTPAEHDAVVNAIVDWVYTDLGLTYDTAYGASAYTSYARDDWERAVFDFTSFLDRRYGSVVNCSDCASILGGYANMMGASLGYAIILQGFDLNYLLAIGGDDFTRCPFGSGRCSFNYHAVTTDDGYGTIWDATLALDGDDDPAAAPNTFMPVHAVPGDEYLFRLTTDGTAYYDHEAQGTIR